MISVANIVEICDKTKNRTIITFGLAYPFYFDSTTLYYYLYSWDTIDPNTAVNECE